ncbi:MAG: nucleoside triphosphate pyrophosphatase [Rickettsiales bacterium]|nr:nucleoside triphosphate pyrophosphatase [Rickettsiales bacterium]
MLITNNYQLILASTSAIRKKILADAGLKFLVKAPLFDEDLGKKKFKNISPKKLAIHLAKEKALSISKHFPNACVIGSDQVCEFLNKEIPKSKDAADAFLQLKKFNGKTHLQNNAVVIAFNNKIIFENFSSVVLKMRRLKIAEIKNYVDYDQPLGCAGSYKYESLGKHLFEKVTGDYYAVLGLAIQPLLNFLHQKKIIKIK